MVSNNTTYDWQAEKRKKRESFLYVIECMALRPALLAEISALQQKIKKLEAQNETLLEEIKNLTPS